jgi:hypothetical protein
METATNRPLKKDYTRYYLGAGISLGVSGLSSLFYWLFVAHLTTVILTSVHWTRERITERQTITTEDDWRDDIDEESLVAIIGCDTRVRSVHRHKKHSHTSYGQWCTYTKRTWTVSSDRVASGNSSDAGWPGNAAGAGERESLNEEYTATFTEPGTGRSWSTAYSYVQWVRLSVGRRYRARWSRAGEFEVSP